MQPDRHTHPNTTDAAAALVQGGWNEVELEWYKTLWWKATSWKTTTSCPGDQHLSVLWGTNLKSPWNSQENNSTNVLKGVEGAINWSTLCRELMWVFQVWLESHPCNVYGSCHKVISRDRIRNRVKRGTEWNHPRERVGTGWDMNPRNSKENPW